MSTGFANFESTTTNIITIIWRNRCNNKCKKQWFNQWICYTACTNNCGSSSIKLCNCICTCYSSPPKLRTCNITFPTAPDLLIIHGRNAYNANLYADLLCCDNTCLTSFKFGDVADVSAYGLSIYKLRIYDCVVADCCCASPNCLIGYGLMGWNKNCITS